MTSKAGAQHPAIARLLHANAQWARDVTRAEPAFFKNSAKGQTPKIFWIGWCARGPTAIRASNLTNYRRTQCGLSSSGECRPCLSPRRPLCPPQHCKVSNFPGLSAPLLHQGSPTTTTSSQFYPDDESALAALQYAVDFVGVNHSMYPSDPFRL